MNIWMMMCVGEAVAASTIKKRVEEDLRKARNATGSRKHDRNRATAEARRDAERAKHRTSEFNQDTYNAIRDSIMETDKCQRPEYDSPTGCFFRIYSLLIGHVILLFCALAIFHNPSRFLGAADAWFWVTVGTLVGARYVDIRYFNGMTAEGKPASIADWRQYAGGLLVVSFVLWISANALGHLWQPPT